MKNNKGITLIALVITIIVLLILAGVSIAMLTGENGILTRANESQVSTNDAEVIEKVNMELSAQLANAMSGKAFDDDVQQNLSDMPEGYTVTATVDNEGATDSEKSVTIRISKPDDSKIEVVEGSVKYDSSKGWKMSPVKLNS